MNDIFHQFVSGLKQTSLLEFIAVITSIASVWFSSKENILVYPIGLIGNIIYVYLSVEGHLLGEASVYIYYTVISIYGWILWSKKDESKHSVVIIKHSSAKEWAIHLLFFATLYIGIYLALSYLKKEFAPGAIPAADAFASATAYTGMWLMAKKKVESWYWWILTNVASIPLYFVKGYVFTSFQFLVLLIMAFAGLVSWGKKQTMQEVKKIVVMGPESTGKSTLCTLLAEHYNTIWCPEFAREYLLANGTNYTYPDLLTIAKGQIKLEDEYIENLKRQSAMGHEQSASGNDQSRISNGEDEIRYSRTPSSHPLLFVDTDMYVMKVWCEYVFNQCHTFILEKIVERKCNLYLLCNIDLPWVKDELREYPDLKSRKELYEIYKDILINQTVPWIKISGSYEDRLSTAVKAVGTLLTS